MTIDTLENKDIRYMILNNPTLPVLFYKVSGMNLDINFFSKASANIYEIIIIDSLIYDKSKLKEKIETDFQKEYPDFTKEELERLVFNEIKKYSFTPVIIINVY